MAYGLGASVVIIGALFKILHLEFGSELLAIGLITEAIIFAISAFEPVDEEYDWSLVYPELAGGASRDRKNKAAAALDGMVDAVTQALKDGDTVSLIGFGTFLVRDRAARTGRNPKTGETIQIMASKSPAFKAGKALKDAVN